MKFVSKNSNYRVVLKHGMQAEPLTGRAAINGVYVKFEDGMADVQDPSIIEMLKNHPAFGRDYIVAEDSRDPYASTRKSTEPEHDIIEIEYGHAGRNLNPKPVVPKDQMDRILAAARELAVPMAKEMVKAALAEMRAEQAPSASYAAPSPTPTMTESVPEATTEPTLKKAKAKKTTAPTEA